MSDNKKENPVLNLQRKDSERYFNATPEQISNWVTERTASTERKARRAIYGEMLVDGILNQIRDIGDQIREVFPASDPVVIGSPSHSAINNVETLLKDRGHSVGNPGEVSVEIADSVTGEMMTTTVGIGNEDGHIIYFGEEKNAVGEIVSRAVVDTGHSYETVPEAENGYTYRLELHYKGGRYSESNAEIDIDSGSSPRATAKTLELLTNVVSKSLKQ